MTPIELFFDLVFFFSLTQVTALTASELTGRGITRGMPVLAVLSWSWVGTPGWGTSCRVGSCWAGAMLAAMAAMFALEVAPEAFEDGLAVSFPGGSAPGVHSTRRECIDGMSPPNPSHSSVTMAKEATCRGGCWRSRSTSCWSGSCSCSAR